MADLAVGLAKTALEGALSRAQSAIDEEETPWLRDSTRRDLVFITGEFEMMLSCLGVADAERVNNSVVRTWLRQVRDLAYDAEDCIELAVHLDSGTSWWRRTLLPPCVPAAAPRLDAAAAAEIERLRARVEDVSRRNSRYSLITDSGSEPGVQQQQQLAPRAAFSAAALDVLGEARGSAKKQWGFEHLTQLIAKDGSDLGVISVLGRSDGLGASVSIIRKAYEDPEICRTFGCRGWVKLEHPFSPHNFLQSVVSQFYANSCLQRGTSVDVAELERMEGTALKEGGLIEEFWTQVNEQRYLLVVENVCNMGEWDAIRACLPGRDNGGNQIIVSTEQREIAGLCIGHSYQVLELNHYSADYPVCVFFKQSSQGDIHKAMPSEITEVKRKVYNRVPMTKQDEARTWMEQNTLVGREAQLKSLRDYQTKARFENWRVMSVWGIAGVGKSALVRKFYYGRMLESPSPFAKYSWVNVVHPLNLIDFSLSLLSDFHSDSLEAMEIKDPVQQCYKLLKENRFLVVINDLQSKEEWNSIKNALVSRHCQSFIIVITTEENIAIYCADNEDIVFNVKGLESEAAFHLFKEKVHRKNPSSPLKDSKCEDIEQLIVKCGGLPKVIVSVADFLAPKTVKSMESTRTINQKFMHELESNPEFGCLRELFDWMHLFFRTSPDFLRPCIFYLSVFPGYQIIRRRRLLMRWVAEGYARDTKYNTAEERAEMLFSMLVNLSMIQPPPCTVITHKRMARCQVNAFFHEYIISRPEEDNIVFALEVFELQGQCHLSTRRTGRHLVIKSSWDRDRIAFDSIDFSRLRSLTVFGKWESFFVSESIKVLRVLDLEDASGVLDKDLEKIVKVFPRLKFLSLRGKREICHLPSLLSELRQLETLDVRGTSIVTLPASITKLKKLQYIRAGTTSLAEEPSTLSASASWLPNLRTSRQQVGVEVPTGIDKLTALHTLGTINAGITWGKATMKELKSLTQLRKLGVSGINRKNIKEVSAAISCHVHLESLSLWLSKGNQCCLEDMSPPKKLKTLKMYGIVKVVPQWIKDLPKLTKLELGMAISEEFDIIGVLGVIKELSFLRLCVKPLHGDGGRLDFCVWVNGQQQRCYLKVKILEVACTSKLTVAFGSEAMQNLEQLTVRCSSASALQVFELKCLSNLKEVRLLGSHDGILKGDLERQLKEHRGRPTLKLEQSCSS
ncbi:hypothetical protein BS78_05G124700 [Paspalum vaginatum]|nr:hypothetical protein BS78_05G124700 [Paspalum vaginatum]